MIATREKLFFLIFFSLCMKGVVFASSENLLSDLSNMGSVSWTEAIADPSEDGSKIAYYSQNPTAEPFFYPRLVSVFEFMVYDSPIRLKTFSHDDLTDRIYPAK